MTAISHVVLNLYMSACAEEEVAAMRCTYRHEGGVLNNFVLKRERQSSNVRHQLPVVARRLKLQHPRLERRDVLIRTPVSTALSGSVPLSALRRVTCCPDLHPQTSQRASIAYASTAHRIGGRYAQPMPVPDIA
eukprot:951406-Rhodomonas_salina.1